MMNQESGKYTIFFVIGTVICLDYSKKVTEKDEKSF